MNKYINIIGIILWLLPLFHSPAIPLTIFTGNGTTSTPSSSPGSGNVLAWWSLNSTLADSTSNGRNLSAVGSLVYAPAVVGDGLDSDNVAERAVISDAAWQTSFTNFSICFWALPDDGQPSATQSFIGKWDTSSNRAYSVDVDTAGKIIFQISSNGTTATTAQTSSAVFSNGLAPSWVFICVTFTSSTSMIIYVNSTETLNYTTSIPSNVYDSSTSINVSCRGSDSSKTFLGGLDQVTIFDKALSQSEISWLYNSGNGRAYSDLY